MSVSVSEPTTGPCPKCGVTVTTYPPEYGLLPEEGAPGKFAVHNWLLCKRTRELADLRARLSVALTCVPPDRKSVV